MELILKQDDVKLEIPDLGRETALDLALSGTSVVEFLSAPKPSLPVLVSRY